VEEKMEGRSCGRRRRGGEGKGEREREGDIYLS
jgi:hypothetical protein